MLEFELEEEEEEVEVEVEAAHVGAVIVLPTNVTAPVCAIAQPFSIAPLFIPMDVRARIFPTNEVVYQVLPSSQPSTTHYKNRYW